MECLHWRTQTPRPTKWVCSPFAYVLVPVSVSVLTVGTVVHIITEPIFLSVSVSGSVNTPLLSELERNLYKNQEKLAHIIIILCESFHTAT